MSPEERDEVRAMVREAVQEVVGNRRNHKLSKEIQRELLQPLGPEYIAHRTGGGSSKVAYLEGHTAIGLANEIFGYDGWSSEIRERKVEYPVDKSGRTCCSVLMRVTLPNGTFREDIGYGSVMKGSHVVQDLEKAGKEACTDALKRVLRQFGEPLGNCLYDKEYIKQIRHVPPRKYDIDIDALRRPPVKRKFDELELSGGPAGGLEGSKTSVHSGPSEVPPSVNSMKLGANTTANPSAQSKPSTRKSTHLRTQMAAPQTNPQPIAESTPLELPNPPTDFILSSSPPDIPAPKLVPEPQPDPGPPETVSRPQFKDTPGLVSGAAIEKFDQTNEWTDASFDASISLGPGCILDQSTSKPVQRNRLI